MSWHQKKETLLFEELHTSSHGLSSEEALKRLEKYGPNILTEKKKKTLFRMFLDQFLDFMILILIVAAIVSGVIGDLTDTLVIFVIVILNAIIGFVQEYRAEQALSALKKMAAPFANVLRNKTSENIPAAELVPGDIVMLEAGKIVPADLRLIEAVQLKVEEAALTGESLPAEKHSKIIEDETLPIGDRKNMAYNGTFVTYGRGTALVVATGMKTELGKIATLLQDEKEVKTPLQKRLIHFSQKLALVILLICAIVFTFGVLRGEDPLLMLLTAISLAVAAIPEALPAVVTVCLALGAKKMVKQHALVRNLPAVETLGSVTFICSDKTGTLTLNKMSAEEIYFHEKVFKAEDKALKNQDPLMSALALSNDAQVDSLGKILGDPTEIALYNLAKKMGFHKNEWEKKLPRIAELPFDSERKCMTTFHQRMKKSKKETEIVSFTKGGIDVLIERSKNILTSKGLKKVDVQKILRINEKMAADGLRVLCIAVRNWDALPDTLSPETVEKDLTILGLVGMMDPPREEAKEAVALCKSAGIHPVMITGDHPFTARTIAQRLGIIEDGSDAIITGRELDALSDEKFKERVEGIRVYARVAPEQKLKIIKALQDRGQFVAMTGDGVNDAPALKRANIGIAMGINGTDVTKEASHMILLDDNFSTIVKAIKEGRRIFDNIRKFIKYTMTSNSGEIWTIFLAPFFGLPIPLLPIHILWINLVTDGLPGLALAMEPAEKGIMKSPPRHPQESIFSHGLGTHIIWVGLLMGFSCIFTQALSIHYGLVHWQTMVFTVLCLSQMGHVLAIRSEKESIFTLGLFSNKPLLGAFLLTFLLQMATIYVPFLNPIFKTDFLTLNELLFTLGFSSIVFFAVEIEKWVKRRKARKTS